MPSPDALVGRARRGVATFRRVHLDGRLPEATSDLLRRWAILRGRAAVEPVLASLLPAVGTRPGGRAPDPLHRWGRRRWQVAGPVERSVHDQAARDLQRVVQAIRDEGGEAFLAGERDGRWHVGLLVEHRAAGVRALARLGAGPGWHLRWRRGSRRGVALLGQGRLPRRARRAERWTIVSPRPLTPGAVVDPTGGIEISFWAPGRGGQLEALARRGADRLDPDASATTEPIGGGLPGRATFAVTRSLRAHRFPIDVVITWVDGDDPAWRAEYERWAARERPELRGDHAIHPSRYADNDELRFALRSLWLHAGWVRHVHVLTAGQRPPWLVEDGRLTVVAHDDVLPEAWLPTFNSHAIEAGLHRIPGLSEHFVYLNDDMFLGRPLRPDALFTPNGIPRYFPSEARVPPDEATGPLLAMDAAARNGRRLIESEFGVVVDHKLQHAPYALRRSTLEDLTERFGDAVDRTGRHRFRHPDDLSVAASLAHHFGHCTGRAIEGTLHAGYEHLASPRLGIFLDRVLLGRDLDVFCLNETEVSPRRRSQAVRRVLRFLEAYFPNPSPWERPLPQADGP